MGSKKNRLNELTAKEWIADSISVWLQKGLGAGHPDTKIERLHPAPFSFTDISRLIKFFTKKNDVILDPFLGVGSTLKACAIEGRNGIGIELNAFYAKLARKRLKNELGAATIKLKKKTVIMVGDSRETMSKILSESIDFVVTSPPYWNILRTEDKKASQERQMKGLATRYSNQKRDLGNIPDYQVFLQELRKIWVHCFRVLRKKKYVAIIVSDFRKGPKYYIFHSDVANALDSIGFEMKGIKILYQSRKKVFPYGYPYSYVPNIHHQYILIAQKP